MSRSIYDYGLIAGIIVGVLLTFGCASETPEITATSTSNPQVEATEFARSANATILSYLEYEGTKAIPFSVNSSNTSLPEDILQEIKVFGGGGGGAEPSPCEEQRGHPFVYIYDLDYEPLEGIFVGTCGWKPGEVVSVMLTRPDDVVISDIRDSIWYELTLDAPLGEYEIVFRGESDELRATVMVALPKMPRLYVRDNELILYNFDPDENIRLLAYQGSTTKNPPAILKTWASFQTDPQGKLIIELDHASLPDSYTYVVVGEKSGEVFPYSPLTISADTVLPLVTISGVSMKNPGTWRSLEGVESLWGIAPHEDLLEPGTNVYDVSLTTTGNILWRFSKCARNEEILQSMLVSMDLRVLINNTEVPLYMFARTNEPGDDGRACRWWATSIQHWPANKVIELTTEYDFAAAIDDGATKYPAGTYRHVSRVTLEP